MKNGLVVSSLLLTTLALTACGGGGGSKKSPRAGVIELDKKHSSPVLPSESMKQLFSKVELQCALTARFEGLTAPRENVETATVDLMENWYESKIEFEMDLGPYRVTTEVTPIQIEVREKVFIHDGKGTQTLLKNSPIVKVDFKHFVVSMENVGIHASQIRTGRGQNIFEVVPVKLFDQTDEFHKDEPLSTSLECEIVTEAK